MSNFIDSVITATAQRLEDVCQVPDDACSRLAHHECWCGRRVCNLCVITSLMLPYERYCCTEHRNEAEQAAEDGRKV